MSHLKKFAVEIWDGEWDTVSTTNDLSTILDCLNGWQESHPADRFRIVKRSEEVLYDSGGKGE